MRIISGTHKSRRISPDKNFKARPTTDFAKENLFNVLNNTINFEDLNVLDLFGGTGSISYEFASRGAEQVICIELNFKHCAFIKKTIKELGFTQIHALRADIFKYLKGCKKTFDLIFADPPYDLDTIDTIPDAIFKQNILNENGIVIVEHSSRNDFSQHPLFQETRSYGSVNFSFFRLKN
ncbi:RsmD family RNA methyltransferase [Ancylomarina sp. 16SWW S1-10-2]|uniref:RsmD family RNA methyltransferase n=1 Tax=Ancylomarina sp. 16SWW S1-10-2 TaxID=2499681 RepID=UPI001D889DE7|nr:methyltransferase domain-containing protein [Ancylomarina sp. 16SWW S1-10-2]